MSSAHLRGLRLAICALLALTGLGCGYFKRQPTAIVPMQPTASDQLRYAEQYKQMRNMALIPKDDPARFDSTRELVRQQYAAVVDYFPGDRFGTPMAKLTLIEMKAGLDSERVAVSDRKVLATVQELVALAEEYPELEFIQAKSLYSQALCYQRAGEFKDASVCFYNGWKRFENSNDKIIKNISARCGEYYNKTQVVE